LLLVANFSVTAAMSGWAAMAYFRVPDAQVAIATIATILLVGGINYFGPKHSGSVACGWLFDGAGSPAISGLSIASGQLSSVNLQPLEPT